MSEFETLLEVHAVMIISKFNKGEYVDSLWTTKEEAENAAEQLQSMGEFFTVEIETYPVKRTPKEFFNA